MTSCIRISLSNCFSTSTNKPPQQLVSKRKASFHVKKLYSTEQQQQRGVCAQLLC